MCLERAFIDYNQNHLCEVMASTPQSTIPRRLESSQGETAVGVSAWVSMS